MSLPFLPPPKFFLLRPTFSTTRHSPLRQKQIESFEHNDRHKLPSKRLSRRDGSGRCPSRANRVQACRPSEARHAHPSLQRRVPLPLNNLEALLRFLSQISGFSRQEGRDYWRISIQLGHQGGFGSDLECGGCDIVKRK